MPAIIANADAIILAHNHPSGDPSPSVKDGRMSGRIVETGKIVGNEDLDQIIVGDVDRCCSNKYWGRNVGREMQSYAGGLSNYTISNVNALKLPQAKPFVQRRIQLYNILVFEFTNSLTHQRFFKSIHAAFDSSFNIQTRLLPVG